MPHDPDHPWMFHRNEVDLLEEDVDEIYRVYGQEGCNDDASDPFLLTMEQGLIQEQIETEEQAEAEFSQNTNPLLLIRSPMRETNEDFNEGIVLTDELFQETKRPPFYEHVFLWATEVSEIADELYKKQGVFREPAFRIYLNVKLIPIKLSVVIEEEGNEEPLAHEIAEKECRLAILYLERVLESMSIISACDPSLFETYVKIGFQMKHILKETYTRMKRRRQGFIPGSI